MNGIFLQSRSSWVRYSKYVIKTGKDGVRYILPRKDSTPEIYDPLAVSTEMVLDALNVGMVLMGGSCPYITERKILGFVQKYGLLGIMTALPTTADFFKYDTVYLPKNRFIRDDAVETTEYIQSFFPFGKFNFNGRNRLYANAPDMQKLIDTFKDDPIPMNMCRLRQYAERVDWIAAQLKDWAFNMLNTEFYYKDYDSTDEETRLMLQRSMRAFRGIAPSYHIELLDKSTLFWDFHSLFHAIEMMLYLLITDDAKPLRICKGCDKVFAAPRSNAVFCSARCKNRYYLCSEQEQKPKCVCPAQHVCSHFNKEDN
jgi:hypothetical protein